jgi:hypothetical protein
MPIANDRQNESKHAATPERQVEGLKRRDALHFVHILSIAVLRSLVQRYVELCAVGALECGDLAPLYGFTLVCVRLKSGVVPPHFHEKVKNVKPDVSGHICFPLFCHCQFGLSPSRPSDSGQRDRGAPMQSRVRLRRAQRGLPLTASSAVIQWTQDGRRLPLPSALSSFPEAHRDHRPTVRIHLSPKELDVIDPPTPILPRFHSHSR